jgi:hypothetical protein
MSGKGISSDSALLSIMQRKGHAKTPTYNANGIAFILDQKGRETFTSALLSKVDGILNVHLITDFDEKDNPVFVTIDVVNGDPDLGVCFDMIKQTDTTVADLSLIKFWI